MEHPFILRFIHLYPTEECTVFLQGCFFLINRLQWLWNLMDCCCYYYHYYSISVECYALSNWKMFLQHSVLETGSVPIFGRVGVDITLFGPLYKLNIHQKAFKVMMVCKRCTNRGEGSNANRIVADKICWYRSVNGRITLQETEAKNINIWVHKPTPRRQK